MQILDEINKRQLLRVKIEKFLTDMFNVYMYER